MSDENETRFDAASAVVVRETTHILARRAQMYTPSRFRSILRVDNSVPSWAEELELQQVKAYAEPMPVNDSTNQLPKPTFTKDKLTIKVVEYGLAYELNDKALERAQRTGENLPARAAIANQTAAEQHLDRLAAVGDTTFGTLGLMNQSITPVTLPSGVWNAAADGEDILADMHFLADSVWDTSKEIFEADTLIIPLARWSIIRSKRLTTGSGVAETVLTAFLRESNVSKVIPWRRANGVGAGGKDRVCAFNSQAEEVASMIIPEEFHDGTPHRLLRAVEVPQFYSAAGVLSHYKQGIAYGDLVAL